MCKKLKGEKKWDGIVALGLGMNQQEREEHNVWIVNFILVDGALVERDK